MGVLARVMAAARGETPAAPASARRGAGKDLLTASGMNVEQLRACWLVASWLLSYPDAGAIAQRPQLQALARTVPGEAGDALARCLEATAEMDPLSLQEVYVGTFDTRRRGCLYLTYFSQGDTRRRGMALVRIKQEFRAAGVEMSEDELPDHLTVVLEFAAAHDPERGAKILRSNRAGLELLRLHLAEIDSPWHGALQAVCSTLPRLDADDREAVARLAAEGPEEETVGLDGYGIGEDSDPLAGGGLEHDARVMHEQMLSGAGCGSHAAAPGPVPLDLMRGRPS